ncbi:MAG: C25 family cysteine peptidase [Candidatus Krumholzibacteria bacterium]|nr:C25 family cysteine peptidase [Candidatus Krumholzibacteria bacterium]
MLQRHRVLILTSTLLLLGNVSMAAMDLVPLGPAADDQAPAVVLTAQTGTGLELSFRAPYLEIEAQEQDGLTYQLVGLPGASSVGRTGQPALPQVTRLVALPDGMTLRIRSIQHDDTEIPGVFRPWPAQGLQPADAREFALDAPFYGGFQKAAAPPLVAVGEPGLIRGLRVVPVHFWPANWDAASGQLKVAASIDVTFDLVPAADAAVSQATGRPLPQTFAAMFADEVLGYTAQSAAMTGPGSYLIIHPDDPTVLDNLKPLLEWRQRQGYNVVVASTSLTGTTTGSIKTYIQNQYDTLSIPLEFVTLVGDATGAVMIPTYNENLSGYHGEGDHEYTLLEGGDVLSDVHLGRLSVTSAAMLTTVVNKIVKYESAPWLTDDTGWFTRAGLTGDPGTSGYSCIWINQWVKEHLLELNYTKVDTIWSGNFATEMMNTVNAGESIFTYRGYFGMSGLHNGFIDAMSNGEKLPFALIVTCDTGSFESDVACRSEAFFRATNGGAVASMGTATIGTHTRYNNCMFQGIMEGVLNRGDGRVGPALTLGKWHLYQNYYALEPNNVTVWSTWNNLMGDPATAIWTAVPKALTVDYPANLTTGANNLPVSVSDGGTPQAGALITVYRKDVFQASAVTDASGLANIPLSALVDGEYLVTVTGHNLLPHLGGVNVGDLDASVNFAAVVLTDDGTGVSSGNADGLANPGETLELLVDLTNHGTGGATDVTAELFSGNSLAMVTQSTVDYGYLASGDTTGGLQSYAISLDAALAGGTTVPLSIVATDGTESWTSLLEIGVAGPAAQVLGHVLDSGTIDPGGTSNLVVTIENVGDLATAGATATLTSNSRWLSVTDDAAYFGATSAGGRSSNAVDMFSVEAGVECYPGHTATLTIDFVFAEGGTASLPVLVTVGSAVSTDPVGPDNYGYYAFDDTDTGYARAPVYDWVEIAPDAGGAGSEVGLQDFGRWQDDVLTMDLPFPFTYYGKVHTKLSVCSNGWISFGGTDQRLYRNWTLPSPGTPDNLVAVYWDDLYVQASNSGIYQWYDAANHQLIIEWDNVANGVTDVPETFQVILTDPAYSAGDTGDGILTMNYQSITQTDHETGYGTVGIQNESRDDAVLYTYFNLYPGGAAPLGAGRSINFRTIVPQVQGKLQGIVTNALGGAPIDGATVSVIGGSVNLFSDISGAYQGGLSIGTYDVAVNHPSFAPDTTRNVLIEEDIETVVDFALTDIAGPTIALQMQPTSTGDTAGPYDIVFSASDHSGVAATHCYYTSSATGGPFELPLVAEGPTDTWRASIPGQPDSTLVQYWLTSTDLQDFATSEPAGAPFNVYSFMVAGTTVLYASDMENATDWSAGTLSDDATDGLWVNVDPNGIFDSGTEVAPEDDFSDPGTMCWVTGQAPVDSNQGIEDVDGGTTTLQSPVFDVSAATGLAVQYRRWYTNDTGNSPGQDNWVVQAQDDSGTWVALENTATSNRSWQEMNFVLADHLTVGPSLRLRFKASDLGSGSLVEAGLDEFQLTSVILLTDSAAPVVGLTSPNGGELFLPGDTSDVIWSQSDDVGVVHVEILLSSDSGATFDQTLASGAFNGTWSWTKDGLIDTTYRLKVICHDSAGNSTEAVSAADFSIDGPTAVGDLPVNRLALAQNSPNPFNPRTTIRFALPTRQDVRLKIYSVEGRLVRTLLHESRAAGTHDIVWSGKDNQGNQTASGLYFYRLVTDSGTLTRKMTLLK